MTSSTWLFVSSLGLSKIMTTSVEVQDKNGNDIIEGDFVYTKFRGGSHEGKVETIVKDQAGAQHEGVASYPKVIYTDQHGHRVAHHPNTLTKQKSKDI